MVSSYGLRELGLEATHVGPLGQCQVDFAILPLSAKPKRFCLSETRGLKEAKNVKEVVKISFLLITATKTCTKLPQKNLETIPKIIQVRSN